MTISAYEFQNNVFTTPFAFLTYLGDNRGTGLKARWFDAQTFEELFEMMAQDAIADCLSPKVVQRPDNIIVNCDSYKVSMSVQYPPGTEYVYSYIESRGGRFDHVVFFGLQVFLKRYLTRPITREMVDDAEVFWTAHGEPFERGLWDYIVDHHDGYLPVSIRALPEGTIVGTKQVLASIVNTDPACFWLTTYLESALLRAVWYPTTVASNSYAAKREIRHYLNITSDNVEAELPFKLHDFGARGVSTLESAEIGGLAHLVNFSGTDTAVAVLAAQTYYGAGMVGYSIPAAEHSTITSWGRGRETDAYRNMIRRFSKPGTIYAVVSDSYDFEHAVEHIWGETLRDEVIEAGGILVVRPDSGDPTVMPVWAVEKLAEKFGTTTNSKGYKVLKGVRVIQGDGITLKVISQILGNLALKGFSAENVAFGMGGKLLQGVDRDTMNFAMKCSAICIDGVWQDVQKDPKTDPNKRSKKGRLAVVLEEGEYRTVPLAGNEKRDCLVEVWRDGRLLVDHLFDDVRARANVA